MTVIMQFTYTVRIDEDFTPWGEPEIVAEETKKINDGEWAPYIVTVRADGPIGAEESVCGCVVPITDIGTYHDLDAIKDGHLKEILKEIAEEIKSDYQDKLIEKRDEINAMILQLGGC